MNGGRCLRLEHTNRKLHVCAKVGLLKWHISRQYKVVRVRVRDSARLTDYPRQDIRQWGALSVTPVRPAE